MQKKLVIFLLVLISLIGIFSQVALVQGVECQSTDTKDQGELQKIIDACNSKLSQLGEQRNTLASQIQYMDTQILLTQVEIEKSTAETELLKKEIKNLGSRISELNLTSDKVTEIVEKKINEMYKKQRTSLVYTFINAYNLPNFLRSIQYLQKSQKTDRQFLLKLQNTKVTYEEQKDLREEKEQELETLIAKLEGYQIELANQQKAKENLLTITKNDENKYQQILAQTRAEYEAIQAIVAGSGTESEVKQVSAGEKIASVIQGASCNSSGTHLHFTVSQGGEEVNPFLFLSSVDYYSYAETDPFNPSGSWSWPLHPQIKFTQGYGSTWAIANHFVWYDFHNGIDIFSDSVDVLSVSEGILYRGSYSGNGGCTLPYVRVDHKDSDINTFYLHVYGI